MEWSSIVANLVSGSIGVAFTLAVTGFWNWRDRKETQRMTQSLAVLSYVKESNAIAIRLLALKDPAGSTEDGYIDEGKMELVMSSLTRLEELFSELCMVVTDHAIRYQAWEAYDRAGHFWGMEGRPGYPVSDKFAEEHAKRQNYSEDYPQQLKQELREIAQFYVTKNQKIIQAGLAAYGTKGPMPQPREGNDHRLPGTTPPTRTFTANGEERIEYPPYDPHSKDLFRNNP